VSSRGSSGLALEIGLPSARVSDCAYRAIPTRPGPRQTGFLIHLRKSPSKRRAAFSPISRCRISGHPNRRGTTPQRPTGTVVPIPAWQPAWQAVCIPDRSWRDVRGRLGPTRTAAVRSRAV